MFSKILTGLFGAALIMFAAATAQAADPKGLWLTEAKTAHVEIYVCGGKLCGKVVWLKEPNGDDGKPKLDKENADESKRSLPILGSIMIHDMEADGDSAWDDGTIYNAEDGKTYSSEMKLDGTAILKVSGCVLFFCKEQIWTKVK